MFTDNFLVVCDWLSSRKNLINTTVDRFESTYTQSSSFRIPRHFFAKFDLNQFSNENCKDDGQRRMKPARSVHSTPQAVCLYHNCLRDVFFNILDPLFSKDHPSDTQIIFLNSLNKNVHLLHTLTSKHKQLHKILFDNATENFVRSFDNTYQNALYMQFWKELLKTSLYIIHPNHKSFSEYVFEDITQSTQPSSILCIQIETSSLNYIFKLLNITHIDDFKCYCRDNSIFKHWDTKSLQKMKMNQLKDICRERNLIHETLTKKDTIELIVSTCV